MKKISSKLMGGLCNYMFQIAATYHFAKKHNLTPFISTKNTIKVHQNIESYKNNIFKNITFENITDNFVVYNENGFGYNDIIKTQPQSNILLNGYFQSYKYLENINVNEIFNTDIDNYNELKQKYKDVLDKNTCSIHVRRGDYVNLPEHHPVQPLSYFMKAIKNMPKDSLFLIFSDDILWCKENFPDMDNVMFVENNKDYEDFILMANCKNNIICNSTFSWWAAYLNKNKEKKVIIPKKWFGNAYVNYDTDGFYCEGWMVV